MRPLVVKDLEEDVRDTEEDLFIWDDGLIDSDDDSISALFDEFSIKIHSTVPAWQRLNGIKKSYGYSVS